MNFSERLLFLLKQNKISANKLTVDLSLSKSAVYEWTKRGCAPNITTLNAIADYFDVSTDFLLCHKDTKKSVTDKDDGLIEENPRVAEIKQAVSQMDDEQINRFYEIYRAVFGQQGK